MPPVERINPIYRDALLAAREAGYAINRRGLERLYAAYARILSMLLNDWSEGALTAARAERLRQELLVVMAQFERLLVRTTAESIVATMQTVGEIHARVTRSLIRDYAPAAAGIAFSLDRMQGRALAAMAARAHNAATFETLYRRRIRSLVPVIDTYLDAAVGRGVAAGRGTVDLARIMANDDPRLLATLDRLRDGPRGDIIQQLHAGVGQIDFKSYGIDEFDVKPLQNLLYDSRRIHVSEANNALRESNTESLNQSPTVTAAKWQTSARHHIPDACTVLSQADLYGYGPGQFPPDKWPLAPHPFCACTQAGPVTFRRPSEWNRPKPPSNPLQRDPGDKALYAAYAEKWTEREMERQMGLVRGVVAEAEGLVGPRARSA